MVIRKKYLGPKPCPGTIYLLLTNYMVQHPSLEANSCVAGQEITSFMEHEGLFPCSQ